MRSKLTIFALILSMSLSLSLTSIAGVTNGPDPHHVEELIVICVADTRVAMACVSKFVDPDPFKAIVDDLTPF